MATEFGQRLRAAREHAGLSQPKLARALGVTQSTIGSAESTGKSSTLTSQIAKICGVDAHWLATGRGSMLPPDAPPKLRVLHTSEPVKQFLSQRPGFTHLDRLLQAVSPIMRPERMSWEQVAMGSLPPLFTLELSDDSMAPEMPAGTTVVLDSTLRDAQAGDAVLVVDRERTPALRIFRPRKPGHFTAAPLNDSFAALDSAADELQVLAVKVGQWGRRAAQ